MIKTFFFHNMIFDLKGHIRSNKALPLMLPPNCMCDSASQHNSHGRGTVPSFASLDVMDNFCPCFISAQGHLPRDNLLIKSYKPDSWLPGVGFFPIAAIKV